ncbi:hypothetical protein [Sphaerisporangium corydalis]|uniref:Uncharacterized protein n=1 Tax=Sphaerisporangium corydalis TaxID=1441875 RepID=A0ABV9ER72_9ACTN|nr:hypothetical protein [Sphaerisporangium corydalis]
MTEMNETNGDLPGDGRDDRHEDAAGTGGQGVAGPSAGRDEWLRERDRERAATGDERPGRREDRPGPGRPAERADDARDDRPDPLASVTQEARRLFDSLQQRVGREIGKGVVKGGVSGLGQAFGGGGRAAGDVWSEAVAGHDDGEYICRACPVCRMKAARRDAGGDVTDHLISAGGELFAAFRQAVDAVSRPAPPRRPGDTDTRVEHIDLG